MKIWSFDLGITSIGYAVRTQTDKLCPFDEVQSLLIHEEYGSTIEARNRRRAHRTRVAHKKREEWLRYVFREVGLGEPWRKARKDGYWPAKGIIAWSVNSRRRQDRRLEMARHPTKQARGPSIAAPFCARS